jgi:hypothetical protein
MGAHESWQGSAEVWAWVRANPGRDRQRSGHGCARILAGIGRGLGMDAHESISGRDPRRDGQRSGHGRARILAIWGILEMEYIGNVRNLDLLGNNINMKCI